MDEIKMFLLGFLLVYIIQCLDYIIQVIGSYVSLIVSKNQKKINDMFGEDGEQPQTIGFQYIPNITEEYYDDEWVDE